MKHVCKGSGSNLQKWRGHLDFWAATCKDHGLASYLLCYRVYSIWGVNVGLILVLRSQFFECLRETLYKRALDHLEAVRPKEKNGSFFFLPTANA